MIRFESVTKQYPDGTIAVDDLSLTAPSGKITVFVGPSGCGKTTSLRMINRMIEPTSGRIWIDDRDHSTVAPAELRRSIGYVIQHAGLFPHRTIVDNVATVPLSGGQQQRVGVARALAADPPVMLMDEPFSAVDPVVREQLQNEFLRLQGELGKTIVFVTHDIDEAIKLGDQVAVLRVGGVLAQLASPAELLSNPVDDFVAGFVGRDRGYRALGFENVTDLHVDPEPTVALGSSVSAAGAVARAGWVLVVDDHQSPQGWLAIDDDAVKAVTEIGPTLLHRGGTVASINGSFRAVLDAALSSPTGRGVIVDEAGRLAGTVTAADVVRLLDVHAPAPPATIR